MTRSKLSPATYRRFELVKNGKKKECQAFKRDGRIFVRIAPIHGEIDYVVDRCTKDVKDKHKLINFIKCLFADVEERE